MDCYESELKKAMALFKYESFQTAFFESSNYEKLVDIMFCDFSANVNEIKFDDCNEEEILKCGEYVIKKHMKDIDLTVPCIFNDDDLSMELFTRFGFDFPLTMYDQVIDYIKEKSELVKVTDIPLTIINKAKRNGYVVNYSFYENADLDESFFEKIPICATGIFIFGPSDDMAKTIYAHEMTHALLNKNKGNILNFMHGEVLPIFMEKVAALDLDNADDLLFFVNYQRLLSLRKNIITMLLEGDNIIDKMYIISSLMSASLFDVYENSSLNSKEEIDKSINQVLMGNLRLEDIFDKYEINLEEGTNVIAKQVKKLNLKI